MTYKVILSERAAQEIEETAAWWARERSVEQAKKWYQGIRSMISALDDAPERFPLASENAQFQYEIREFYYGVRSKLTHRGVFTILRETVLVLTVRHLAQSSLQPEDF